jgi:hypothetical protein
MPLAHHFVGAWKGTSRIRHDRNGEAEEKGCGFNCCRNHYLRCPHFLALSIAQILRWADRHHRQTGDWPANNSGDIKDILTRAKTRRHRAAAPSEQGLRQRGHAAPLRQHRRPARSCSSPRTRSRPTAGPWLCENQPRRHPRSLNSAVDNAAHLLKSREERGRPFTKWTNQPI